VAEEEVKAKMEGVATQEKIAKAAESAPSKVGEAPKPKPKARPKKDGEGNIWMTRRNFFSAAGWIAFFSFIGTMIGGSLRFMFPRVLFEPSQSFKAGFPDEYAFGVDTKWVKDYRVWIVREPKGFYALLAVCTHLGCTPRYLEAENKIKCPCHGSGFSVEGINYEGPAPRPLERVKITVAEDGQILVDKSVRFRYEKGEWSKPGAYLHV